MYDVFFLQVTIITEYGNRKNHYNYHNYIYQCHFNIGICNEYDE